MNTCINMNNNRIIRHLKEGSNLSDTSISTLRNLSETYPYASIFHMMLTKKLKASGDIGYQDHLSKAAIYINDRKVLFEYLHQSLGTAKEDTEKKNDKITKYENKTVQLVEPPATFFRIICKDPPFISFEKNENEIAALEEKAIRDWNLKLNQFKEEHNDIDEGFSQKNNPEITIEELIAKSNEDYSTVSISKEEEFIEIYSKNEATEKQQDKQEEDNHEQEHSSVFSALSQENLSFLPLRDESDIVEDDWDDQSTDMNENIISENLAKLLAIQGKKAEATKMYKALSLKIPEKSLFFAEQIEKLS